MDNKLYEVIVSSINATFDDFSKNPFDFVQNEREAQYCLFEKLKDKVQGSMKVQRQDSIPPFENMNARRVRVEYKLKNFVPDIVIFKENIINTKETDIDDVEAFIEVKIGWGCNSGCFTGDGFYKDILNLKKYPSKGFIVYYMGDNFDSLSSSIRSNCKKIFQEYKDEIDFKNTFIVFRDRVINSNEIESAW
ncbi:hypothetical protein [Clostridium formicaceticum]|uniref:Restriction endonuclease n=1 Tax=Clostridium formicaceticum TaxID=1497 RepID=A0AAC9RJE3_9CLOT|nr:hypothetical protein [Clostridium formicaceticum]AOY76725.1 hypothetical protein BJL90_13120 [Clostridium formicaceticum]ARE87161.1 hypothetical protein CLFO_15490 [Clostridium formicaceticum]